MVGIGKIEELIVLLIILAEIALDVIMIAQVSKRQQSALGKLFWIAIIIALPFLGALYYAYWANLYKRRRPQETKE